LEFYCYLFIIFMIVANFCIQWNNVIHKFKQIARLYPLICLKIVGSFVLFFIIYITTIIINSKIIISAPVIISHSPIHNNHFSLLPFLSISGSLRLFGRNSAPSESNIAQSTGIEPTTEECLKCRMNASSLR
jgi:hypothetical protein